MDNRMTPVDSFLPYLKDKYDLVHIETGDTSQIYLRGNMLCKEEAEQFIKDFSKCTKTEWNVAYEMKTPTKTAFHKLWCCQFSCRHKGSNKKKTEMNYKNLNCLANINIFVKRVTINTKRTDEYLCRYPPLAAVIKIKQEHSHSLNSTDMLRMRRPTEETKAKFEQYFEMGLSIPECRYLHASLLTEKGVEDLVDTSVNPTAEQVAYLYKVWKTHRENGYPNLSEKTKRTTIKPNSCLISNLRVDDQGSSDSENSSFELVGNSNSSKCNKRSYLSPEVVVNLKRTKTENNVLSDYAENSECSLDKDEIYLYEELHKRFDLMDEESSDVSQKKSVVSRKCKENDQGDEGGKDKSETVDSVVTYFVFGPSKTTTSTVCEVSHAKAAKAAKLLLKYMERQSDTDLADIITVRRYLRKIKNKIENPLKMT